MSQERGLRVISYETIGDFTEAEMVSGGVSVDGIPVLPVGIELTELDGTESAGLLVTDGGDLDCSIGLWNIGLTVLGARAFSEDGLSMPRGSLALFHHRKSGKHLPEPQLRMLRITGRDHPERFPATEFHFGEHPDHPGQLGVYLLAQHVGGVSLRCLEAGRLEGVQLVEPRAVRRKFFPIGAAALASI